MMFTETLEETLFLRFILQLVFQENIRNNYIEVYYIV